MSTADADLLKAASAGDLAVVSRALDGGANVNAKDEYNNTSLNWAALFGRAEVAKRLLEAGADVETREAAATGRLDPIGPNFCRRADSSRLVAGGFIAGLGGNRELG